MAIATDSLTDVMAYLAEHFEFTSDKYPELALLESMPDTERLRSRFGVRHSQEHILKSLGKLGSELEYADHEGEMNEAILQAIAVKLVVSSLNLVRILGINGQDLPKIIPVVMRT